MTNDILSTIIAALARGPLVEGVEVSARLNGADPLILFQWIDEEDFDRVLFEIFPAPASVRELLLTFLFRCGTEENPWEAASLYAGADGEEWWFVGETA